MHTKCIVANAVLHNIASKKDMLRVKDFKNEATNFVVYLIFLPLKIQVMNILYDNI